MLFVFGVSAVTNSFGRIEIPILRDGMFAYLEANECGWRYGMNADVGSKVSGREVR